MKKTCYVKNFYWNKLIALTIHLLFSYIISLYYQISIIRDVELAQQSYSYARSVNLLFSVRLSLSMFALYISFFNSIASLNEPTIRCLVSISPMQTILILGHRAETRKDRESNTIRPRAQHIHARWTHAAKVRRANYGDVLVGRRMCHGITIRRDISWGRLRGWRRRCDCMGRSFRPLGISADHPLYIRGGYRANDWKIICSFPALSRGENDQRRENIRSRELPFSLSRWFL